MARTASLLKSRLSFGFGTILTVATVLISGCGGGPGADVGDGGVQRQFLSLGTAPPGGAFYPVGGALSEVLNQAKSDAGWEVNSEATKGSQENIRRLASGDLDLALSNSAITYFAVRGTEGWEQAYDVKAVMTLAPNVGMFITPKSSGVKTIQDLVGKRVVIGPAGAGFEYFVRPLLAAHEVSYDDFTVLNNTQAGAVDMLADGSAAAAFLGGAVPTASIAQAASSQDIFFVPFSEEAKATALERYPFFLPATIPADSYRGQSEVFEGLAVGSMHLITRADASDDLVYEVTKSIYENREKVVERHAAGRAIQPGVVVRDTGTEFHAGAIRFYREIGIWPEE